MNLAIYPPATLNKVWSGPLLSMWNIFGKRMDAKVDLWINNPGDDFKETPKLSLKTMRRSHRKMMEQFVKDRVFYIRQEMDVIEKAVLYERLSTAPSDQLEELLIPIMDLHTNITHLPQREVGEQCERFTDMVFNRIRLMMALVGSEAIAGNVETSMYVDFSDSLLSMMDHFVRSPGSDNTLAFLRSSLSKVSDVRVQGLLKELTTRCIVYRNAIIMPSTNGLGGDRILPGSGRLYDKKAPEAAREVFNRSVKNLTKVASKGTGLNSFDIIPALLEYQTFSPVQLYIDGA